MPFDISTDGANVLIMKATIFIVLNGIVWLIGQKYLVMKTSREENMFSLPSSTTKSKHEHNNKCHSNNNKVITGVALCLPIKCFERT